MPAACFSHTLKPAFVSSCEHLDVRISLTVDAETLCSTHFRHYAVSKPEAICQRLED